MTRKYTGWDKNATGRRAGTEKLVQLFCYISNNGFWNNGTWAVREVRGGSKPSVHGTGRAMDLSWRKANGKGYGDYAQAVKMLDFVVEHADVLGVEEIHDYFHKPHGRGWKCDRASWKVYDKPTIGPAGSGQDWFHIEISNDHADDPSYYADVFAKIFSGEIKPQAATPAPAPVAAPPAAPKPAVFKSLKVGSKGSAVKEIQTFLGLQADGNFGPKTEAAVKAWQLSNPVCGPADGIVGAKTWSAMFHR
jgi:hypothetical protein